jgi:hypothetical protein
MPVTLSEVNDYVSREATRRNGKIVPALPGMLHKLCHDPYYYIFNVGPWQWRRQLGGRGTRTVQKCADGKEYSDPLPMPKLDNETVASDMNKMENRQEDGIEVVDAFMMRGYGFRPEQSLENWGVLAIDHWPPTKEEIQKARKNLSFKYDELIAEADRYQEQRKHEDIGEFHRLAARSRGLNKAWLNENPDLVPCGACGMSVMPNIAKCPHCRATLNVELARKFFPEEYRPQERPVRG